VGKKVILTSPIYPKQGDWEFQIVGVYTTTSRSVDRNSFIFRWDYMNESLPQARKDYVGWIVSRVDDPARSADTGIALDKVFDEKEVQTLSQDEGTFQSSFLASMSAVLTAIDIISIVIMLIMALVLGNTIAMGVRERTNEYGVLKALGFTGTHIAFFIVGESVLIALIGGAIGIGLAYPFIQQGIGRWLTENMDNFFRSFAIESTTTAAAAILAFAIGGLAAAIPAMRASQLRVVDALRRVA